MPVAQLDRAGRSVVPVRAAAAVLAGRWRLLPRRVRLLLQVLAVLIASGAAFAVLLRRADISSTGASILVGIGLAAIGVLQTRQSEKRQRTVDLIAALQSSDTLSAADCWTATWRALPRRPVRSAP